MIMTCGKSGRNFDENFFKRKRFVFEAEESKEKAAQTAVPEEEKIEARKKQARQEIDGFYEVGKYDTYNFRKLPAEFKAHMKDNFGQWIDAQIAKYDEDKNSGIDAKEYAKFKQKLQEKVEEILDRLVEAKKEKKKEAEAEKKSAEQAKEAQKRLEGVDISKIDYANLETADGIYTELLKYQKDFENEATQFGSMAAVFGEAKEKIDGANKSHTTGVTAFGEMLVSWVSDIPEVADAKKAKEKAVADFRAKLGEMKKRQKDRQNRGAILNGAPEKVKAKRQKYYEDETAKFKEAREDLKKKRDENEKKRGQTLTRLAEMEETRKKLQKKYDEIMSRFYAAQQRKKDAADKKAEMDKAEQGLAAAESEMHKKKGDGTGGAAEPGAPASGTGAAEIEAQTEKARGRAMEASRGMGTGLQLADTELSGMSGSAQGLQKQLSTLLESRSKANKDVTTCDDLERQFAESDKKLGEGQDSLEKAEKAKMEQLDSLDEGIASTVLEVDTANFELIKKGEEYLKTLSSMDAKGPGVLDTVGAMFKGIPGVEKGTGWVGKKLDGAWAWAKKAPVLGFIIGSAGYAGEGWVKGWDWIGKQFTDFADWARIPDAWDAMSHAERSWGNSTSSYTLNFILGGLGTVVEVFAGVTEGCKDLVKGLGMMVQHPFETVRGLAQLVNHPGMIVDAFIQKDKWEEESVSKLIGRGMIDVVTTLTGAGATAQGVKISIAAVKIAGMTTARAIALGAEMFVRVFVRDISGFVVGVIKLPVTVTKGAGRLVMRLARGGEEVAEAAAAAKKAVTAEEAFTAVEATRGKPTEFAKLMREHPEYLDLHTKFVRARAAERKAEAGKKQKPEPKKVAPEEKAKPVTEEDPAAAAAAAKAKAEEATKPPPRITEEFKKKQAEAQQAAKEAQEIIPKPDFDKKKITPERSASYDRIAEDAKKVPALKATVQTLGINQFVSLMEALPINDLKILETNAHKLDAILVQKILKQDYGFTINAKGEKIRFYAGQTLGEGGFGIVSDCVFLVEGHGHTLEFASALKMPKNTDALRLEITDLLGMIRDGKVSGPELARLNERAAEIRKKIMTEPMPKEDRVKMAAELHEMEEVIRTGNVSEGYMKELRARLADYNFQLSSIERIFANERMAMEAVAGFGETRGLLRPRVVSKPGLPVVIIYEKVEPVAGKKITLKDRFYSDRPEDVLGHIGESLQGLDMVHEHGWVHMDYKPENVFVGRSGTGEAAFLGDLALVSVEEISQLRLIEAHSKKGEKSKSYAVVRMGPNGSIADSRQIGITPSYFNPDHINALIEYAKKAAAEAKAKGLDPSKIKIPKEVLALADKNQVGVSLERYMRFLQGTGESGKIIPGKKAKMARDWGIPESAMDEVIAELAYLSSELKKADSAISIPEVMVSLEAARAKLMRARVPSALPGGELPKPLSI